MHWMVYWCRLPKTVCELASVHQSKAGEELKPKLWLCGFSPSVASLTVYEVGGTLVRF